MNTQEKFAAAAKAGLCNFLSATGSAAASYAAWGLVTPGPFDEWAALGYAAVAGLAYNAGCTWDSGGTPPPSGGIDGCKSIDGGVGSVQVDQGAGWQDYDGDPASWDITDILGVDVTYSDQSGLWVSACNYRTNTGIDAYYVVSNSSESYIRTIKWRLRVVSGTCSGSGTPTPEPIPPITWTDPDDGCEINVTFEGWVVGDGGVTGAGWKLEPATVLRSSGGIIGGCNFAPVLYYQPPGGGGGGSGGGGTEIPWNPGPDGPNGEPWWVDLVRSAAGGVAGALVKTLIDQLLEPSVGAKVYRLTSVCETNAAGEPVDLVREVDIPTLSILQAAIYRLDAIEYLLQGLKDFKQPTCRKCSFGGELVSVHFKSDEISPNGNSPLRKLFRYRDQTGTPLDDHVTHWESFVWQAGPVAVIHKGAPWGYLQVWTADAEEGKRVIRHAGSIAGVDPDAEGEWLITGSADPRYGQPGTMRISSKKSWGGQFLQISKRSGPSGLPIVPFVSGV